MASFESKHVKFGKHTALQAWDSDSIKSAEEAMRKECMEFLEEIGVVKIQTEIGGPGVDHPVAVGWVLDPECMPKYDSEGGRKE